MRRGYKGRLFLVAIFAKVLNFGAKSSERKRNMSCSRLLLRTRLLSRFFQRTFATEVAVSPPPRLEYYVPIELERAQTAAEIAEKGKKPWTELSKDDKIASTYAITSLHVT